MTSCVDIGSEKVCYIPCNFCNIILAVSVPCSSLFDIVTVRCGHCTHLWSVNMAAALHSALSWPDIQAPYFPTQEYRYEYSSSSRNNKANSYRSTAAHHDERISTSRRNSGEKAKSPICLQPVYQEEIQRIKANNPAISHREAFSTAAKNWAHYPHIHFGLMLEANNQQT